MRAMSASIRRFAIAAVPLLACGTAVFASANGLPHLDRTHGGAGTVYRFVAIGSALPMSPGGPAGAFVNSGTMTITQDSGSSDFEVVILLDTDGDTQPDRTLSCEGRVGNGNFGIDCSDDDGLGELRFSIAGKAMRLLTGKLALRKATGRGFSEDLTFGVAVRATEQ